ncbi:MAG: hypothetical protein JXA23_01780 [Bacteroidales bacterium]|nr:hypothetical protein [Bacteroidales bacterium]
MKKTFTRLFFVLFAAGMVFATLSCKKCRECTAYEDYGSGYTYYYESQCYTGINASNKIDDWEASFRINYAGYYIECNDTK